MAIKQHIKLRYKTFADREVIENLCRMTRMNINEFASKAIQQYAQSLIEKVEAESKRLKELNSGTGFTDSAGTPEGEPSATDSAVLAHPSADGTETEPTVG